MAGIEGLVKAYERFVRLPWDQALAGAQRAWFAIYEPTQERRLRLRIPEFEVATKNAGHGWTQVDLTDAFAHWMAGHEYREAYFESPEDMTLALEDFAAAIVAQLHDALHAPTADANTVVAVVGIGSLFGLMYASDLLKKVTPAIRGRLLIFFPGQRNGSNYRLLDARDGWNYLAVPIEATEEK